MDEPDAGGEDPREERERPPEGRVPLEGEEPIVDHERSRDAEVRDNSNRRRANVSPGVFH